MTRIFEEVEYKDGVQEFIENEYITELLPKGSNIFRLRAQPSLDSIKFSGDVSLFKKQVYEREDLSIPSSWMLEETPPGNFRIIIDPNLQTSEFTYTYITYQARAKNKKEGLYSIDYNKGILYLSSEVKDIKISYRTSIQYIEGQQMLQVPSNEYTKETIYSIPVDSDNRLTYIYQIKNTPSVINSKEFIDSPKASFITLGDKDD